MNTNENRTGYGKFEHLRGTTIRRFVKPGTQIKGAIGKGLGKSCNAPMDSDAEFEKRLKRYQRERAAELEPVSA